MIGLRAALKNGRSRSGEDYHRLSISALRNARTIAGFGIACRPCQKAVAASETHLQVIYEADAKDWLGFGLAVT